MSYQIIRGCTLTDLTLSKEQGPVSCSFLQYILKYAIQIKFPTTNNIAEFEGLVTGTPYQGRLSAGSKKCLERI
jgi:hypothetical protein